jgi:hypothetical protein
MRIKVQLFDKVTHQEVKDIQEMYRLRDAIRKILSNEFSMYDNKVRVYGELIPIEDVADPDNPEHIKI